MSAPGIKLTGILLAGGKSKRFGREKGNIRLNNKRLYEYPLSLLERSCEKVLISTCQQKTFKAEHQCVCDEIKGIGPMGGIYSCLKQSETDLNLVLSYDLPLVNQELINYLLEEWKEEDVLLPALADGIAQPLCGIYRRQVVEVLEVLIAQKDYAVHKMLSSTSSRILQISEAFEWEFPDLFLNINREEDLRRLPPGFSIKADEQ